MKKTFYIDFSGYLEIKAENEEQAEKIFWENFVGEISLTDDTGMCNDVWEIDAIEEKNIDK